MSRAEGARKAAEPAEFMAPVLLLCVAVAMPRASALRQYSWGKLPVASRRGLLEKTAAAAVVWPWSARSRAAELDVRDRGQNADALIRNDLWYEKGVVPPRQLDMASLPRAQDPVFSAWERCTTRPCTYIPVQQRYTGMSKYAGGVRMGLEAFEGLKASVTARRWEDVLYAVQRSAKAENRPNGPVFSGLLKGVLLANALLISENTSSQQDDVLLARFYLNEAAYAARELGLAGAAGDADRAMRAWTFGRDSLNSYVVVVNRAIDSERVGDKFAPIGS